MFANRFIKKLSENPEALWLHNPATGESRPDPSMAEATLELIAKKDAPVNNCQFFDFGHISNDSIREESLTVVEAFYEGFARLPAPLCFMEHHWEAPPSLCRSSDFLGQLTRTAHRIQGFKGRINSGYIFADTGLVPIMTIKNKIACLEVREYTDFPNKFIWDGISLALDTKNQRVGGGYLCEVVGNIYDSEFDGANWFDPLLTMLGRLNAIGMEKNYVEPPAKLSRARAKKGLPGMVAHTEVKIAPYRAPLGHSGERITEEYTRKRYHFRRGHVRRFENGEKTWVRPCFVGTPEDGTVEHNYVVNTS